MEKPSKILNSGGGDRISELPEGLLLRILSFLPTKLAVQTSILAKSWRYLWASVTILELDQREFSNGCTSFVNFVERVLVLRDHARVGRFQLWWHDNYNTNQATTWVYYAMKHNVRELILDVSSEAGDELVTSICTCQSLEELIIKAAIPARNVLRVPDSVGFSKLKRLHLRYLCISSDVGQLISNCPVLEDLQITVCISSDVNICAPNLKSLLLFCIGKAKSKSKSIKVQVSTPSLVSFRYTYVGLLECSLVHIPSLKVAHIDALKDRVGNCINVGHMLRSLCNISVLRLTDATIELLSKNPDLSKCEWSFHSLECLEWRSMEPFLKRDNIQVITFLLMKCPNLETFVIKIPEKAECQLDLFGLEDDWKPQKLQYVCHLYHLKKIKIHGFNGGMDGLEFLNFLLENARALQKMDLIYKKGSPLFDMHMKVYQKIHTLPRASSTAKVVFCT